jgi:hypothetical protein
MKARVAVMMLAACVAGCGPYAGLQADLASQAREGLRRVEAARRADAEATAWALIERRRRLDEAFDADVRTRTALDAVWVIEARRAYAAGLDALAEARARHSGADAVAADNARAADEALALLERMLRRQERLLDVMKGDAK